MKYQYIPDTYNNNVIKTKFSTYEDFLQCQIKYRQFFEKLLTKYLNFNYIDTNIIDMTIPQIPDNNYNFYHKYSTLNSKYIFLRNNFHVENLTTEEINYLTKMHHIDRDFFQLTLAKVLFEPETVTFFGPPNDYNKVVSNSLVFEFAYNQLECHDLTQINNIEVRINNTFQYIYQHLKNIIGYPISFIVYPANPDLYQLSNQEIDYQTIK